MNSSTIGDVIRVLRDEVSVELADKPELILEAHRLRYQVYCVERGFEPGQNGLEVDQYDDHSSHAIVRWRDSRDVVGTVRMILPRPGMPESLPFHSLCDPRLLRNLPAATIGEGSRFSISKQRRGLSTAPCSILRFALMQAAIWLSHEAGHSHMVAVMEPTLVRLFRATAFHFVPLGPLVEYHGLRQPVIAEMVPTLARMAQEQPAIWEYISREGQLFPSTPSTNTEHVRYEELVAA